VVVAYDCGLMFLCVRVLKVAGAGFCGYWLAPEKKEKFKKVG